MEINPTTPEVIKPTSNTGRNSDKFGTAKRFLMLITPAPSMTGIDIKNENLAASSLLSFRRIPPAIVEPDRDNPGKIARI